MKKKGFVAMSLIVIVLLFFGIKAFWPSTEESDFKRYYTCLEFIGESCDEFWYEGEPYSGRVYVSGCNSEDCLALTCRNPIGFDKNGERKSIYTTQHLEGDDIAKKFCDGKVKSGIIDYLTGSITSWIFVLAVGILLIFFGRYIFPIFKTIKVFWVFLVIVVILWVIFKVLRYPFI